MLGGIAALTAFTYFITRAAVARSWWPFSKEALLYGWLADVAVAGGANEAILAYVLSDVQNDGTVVGYEGAVANLTTNADREISSILLADCEVFYLRVGSVGVARRRGFATDAIPQLYIDKSRIKNIAFEKVRLLEAKEFHCDQLTGGGEGEDAGRIMARARPRGSSFRWPSGRAGRRASSPADASSRRGWTSGPCSAILEPRHVPSRLSQSRQARADQARQPPRHPRRRARGVRRDGLRGGDRARHHPPHRPLGRRLLQLLPLQGGGVTRPWPTTARGASGRSCRRSRRGRRLRDLSARRRCAPISTSSSRNTRAWLGRRDRLEDPAARPAARPEMQAVFEEVRGRFRRRHGAGPRAQGRSRLPRRRLHRHRPRDRRPDDRAPPGGRSRRRSSSSSA